MIETDVLIIGAGAAGLMCAIEAGRRGRSVIVLDHAKKPAEKIRISGGGRCNFTNVNTEAKHFISQNPHFCKSALKRFTPQDFVKRVEARGIPFHEKTLGQLFCDTSAADIINLLLDDCAHALVEIKLQSEVSSVDQVGEGFQLETSSGLYQCQSLVVATGGKPIPKMGATGFAYDIAQQFGLDIVEPRPGLVPFTYSDEQKKKFGDLSGISFEAVVKLGKIEFKEALLFTHRGLSGPAILQISSYWREGDEITIDLAPGIDIFAPLKKAKDATPKQTVRTALAQLFPKKAAEALVGSVGGRRIGETADRELQKLADHLRNWRFRPQGTEGYRTAEVTLGGIDTKGLSSKTMEANEVKGLYFIGEAVDVTGHLGGFNFQWAWASGHAAGQVV